ncbi:MAG: nucleotidyl transferase AbiEii/AbiGii toxin family protein [Deltaproteobacteria bacterium]|nr:MAG: nucleotidyl transferase AbiEii/AbiGii toxin family protein [Deltaproteobacteria bacterium]
MFHLCFLQEFLRKFDPKLVVLKGGVNLRMYFKSRRYSEDMDLDVKTASVTSVQNNTIRALKAIQSTLKTYGIFDLVLPSLQNAKQTETTQRFKVHLVTKEGLDFFTKIEFSRRGFSGESRFERVDEDILRSYRLASVVAQHYDASSAFEQKIKALAGRSEVQARDVFDLFHLMTFIPQGFQSKLPINILKEAAVRLEDISFEQYRDSVVSFLVDEDQVLFGRHEMWEEMQQKVHDYLGKGKKSRRSL